MIDLLETKRIKEILSVNPKIICSVIENTNLAISITIKSGEYIMVNDNYAKLYGYSKEELIGQSFTIVLPETNKAQLEDYHAGFFADKYELIRKWVVKSKSGRLMEVYSDEGFNDQIINEPCKLTLTQFIKDVESDN